MLKQAKVSYLTHQLWQQLAAKLGVADLTINNWENSHIEPDVLALKQPKTMSKELHYAPEINPQE
ncbi:transcriptional regulator [Tolypothrix sp. PCC 7910]|uniref:transcriptional regulator n=1 Tax=Tolypothrix sp. PCC 7910 TaxID=2099387 RepID=UPI0014277E59|nr:transcriptional regulator [Tolypothrix sp. PCC 7910]QIR35433.1 transcriptional regulator [Tolypothrix sp. PCC 7910]